MERSNKKVSFSDSCHDDDSSEDVNSRLLLNDDEHQLLRTFSDEEDGLVKSTRLDLTCSSDPSTDEAYPIELKKTFVSFCLMALSFFLNFASLAVIHEFVPNDDPLPDVVLSNSPYYSWALSVSEIVIQTQIPITILIILLHKHRSIVGRRVMMVMALLYGYRSVTIFVTQLPKSNPNYYCTSKLDSPQALTFGLVLRRVAYMLSGFGLSINGHHIYCGDYMYSGHTMIMVLTNLVVREYTSQKYWWLHWIYFLSSLSGVVFLLLGKGHYTLDVVVAYWITTRLWYIVHSITYRPLDEALFFKRLWWFSVFWWFESKVKSGHLPHGFNMPLLNSRMACPHTIFSFKRKPAPHQYSPKKA